MDVVFVDDLKKRLKVDPSSPGTPPLAVVCKAVSKTDLFNEHHKDVYEYKVLGGLHGARARRELREEQPEQSTYSKVFVFIVV